ncbi:TIGR02117 family protein [Aurantivibrio infirmus]
MGLLGAIFKLVLGIFAVVIIVFGGYWLTAFGFQFFPVNEDVVSGPEEFEAYIVNNGVHADFVFPVQSAVTDWRDFFPVEDLPVRPFSPTWISIGWGDREFYTKTPEWKDLTLERAWDALSGGNATLLHVAYFQDKDLPMQAYKLNLSKQEYQQLVGYVVNSMASINSKAIPLKGYSYADNDMFYEAVGSYNVLTTCNTWVGDGLKFANYKVSAWTPFASNVTWHLEQR